MSQLSKEVELARVPVDGRGRFNGRTNPPRAYPIGSEAEGYAQTSPIGFSAGGGQLHPHLFIAENF